MHVKLSGICNNFGRLHLQGSEGLFVEELRSLANIHVATPFAIMNCKLFGGWWTHFTNGRQNTHRYHIMKVASRASATLTFNVSLSLHYTNTELKPHVIGSLA